MPRDDRSIAQLAVRVDIVAIGASAGGVEALGAVLSSLPAGFPVAVLIVQHLDPRYRSRLAEVFSRHCRLSVKEAVDGEVIQPGAVYVARPGVHLLARGGRLVLSDTGLVHFSRPSIDRLFESVADAYGDHAIGVILSGTGRDGAAGLQAIKNKGGTTIVQDPATAAYDGMPQAARATGCVDFTLPLGEIGPVLASLVGARAGSE
jgi:two-component system, chemotaxis family, protein-glutamate methylesterase/glutaminase